MPAHASPPETILFAVDLDCEACTSVGRNWSRLDVIKHAISNFVRAKRWTNTAHKFGLVAVQQDTCVLQPLGVTGNVERFVEALAALQPPAPADATTTTTSTTSTSSSRPLDLGSLLAATRPLQHGTCSSSKTAYIQQQHMHGGVLTPAGSSSSGGDGGTAGVASSSGGSGSRGSETPQQPLLRVVLVYCRSRLPAPVWHSHLDGGLAVDCLHVHDKPQPGEQQQQLQEVYSALEGLVDKMAMKAGHASLIYESTAKNLNKLLSCMSMILSHPMQRPPQTHAKPPVDLATTDLQPLPSDAANLQSGVPIIPAAKLPAAPGGAWARPLSAGAAPADATAATAAAAAAAGDAGSSTPGWLDLSSNRQAAAASQAAPGQYEAGPSHGGASSVVTGVPVGCVTGVPNQHTPTLGMNLEEGVVVGLDARASMDAGTSSVSGSAWQGTAAADGGGGASMSAANEVESSLDGLADSLRESAIESKDMSAFYPQIK